MTTLHQKSHREFFLRTEQVFEI